MNFAKTILGIRFTLDYIIRIKGLKSNFDDFGGSHCTQASGTKILRRLHIFQAYEELAHMKPVPNCCFSLIIFYISLIFGASVFLDAVLSSV